MKESEKYDRRLVVNFSNLNERQEYMITNTIIEWIYYYDTVINISESFDANTIFNYCSKNIMKPYSIEALLLETSVQIDTIRYIENYYKGITFLKRNSGKAKIIDKTKPYSREAYINIIKYLLQQNKGKREIRDIIVYLRSNGINENNIRDEYVIRILNKIYKVT